MRWASRTSSWPFSSSEPTLSRPTVGRVEPCTARWKAAPMMANSTSRCGVAVDVGADVEHGRAASQRRPVGDEGGPVQVGRHAQDQHGDRHQRAGVAGGDRGAAASPVFTASTAFHMLVPLPRRIAWAGFSSDPDHALGVADLDAAGQRRQLGQRRSSAPPRRRAAGNAAAGHPEPPPSRCTPPLGTPSLTTRATAGATTEGPWSPPIASMEITRGSGKAVSMLPAGRERAASLI